MKSDILLKPIIKNKRKKYITIKSKKLIIDFLVKQIQEPKEKVEIYLNKLLTKYKKIEIIIGKNPWTIHNIVFDFKEEKYFIKITTNDICLLRKYRIGTIQILLPIIPKNRHFESFIYYKNITFRGHGPTVYIHPHISHTYFPIPVQKNSHLISIAACYGNLSNVLALSLRTGNIFTTLNILHQFLNHVNLEDQIVYDRLLNYPKKMM